jgi:hypothetical protein
MEDQYPSYIRFLCHFSDKSLYQQAMQKTFYSRGNVIREKIRDLKDDFHAEVEIGCHGSSLYKELSQMCSKTYLLSSI